MKTINRLAIFIFFLIFCNGCAGYKPIFASSDLQFKISEYEIEGNKKIGNKIYAKLYNLNKSNDNNKDIKTINIFIKSSKSKEATSKDSAGKALEYKITLTTEVRASDYLTDDEILNQTFSSSIVYKLQKQYSDSIRLENKSVDDLIQKTYQELLIRLSNNISK
tara:strand:+ start:2416 stop:2907 length:492 start_codon:yes stop_codon:yes gene_type:complete